jgi:hypothetical protein
MKSIDYREARIFRRAAIHIVPSHCFVVGWGRGSSLAIVL